MTEWLPGWRQRDFLTSSKTPVANRALIEYLAALLAQREVAGQRVRFEHVYGHVGIEGNEGADRLANEGATRPERPERDWDALREDVERKMEERMRAGTKVHLVSCVLSFRGSDIY